MQHNFMQIPLGDHIWICPGVIIPKRSTLLHHNSSFFRRFNKTDFLLRWYGNLHNWVFHTIFLISQTNHSKVQFISIKIVIFWVIRELLLTNPAFQKIKTQNNFASNLPIFCLGKNLRFPFQLSHIFTRASFDSRTD